MQIRAYRSSTCKPLTNFHHLKNSFQTPESSKLKPYLSQPPSYFLPGFILPILSSLQFPARVSRHCTSCCSWWNILPYPIHPSLPLLSSQTHQLKSHQLSKALSGWSSSFPHRGQILCSFFCYSIILHWPLSAHIMLRDNLVYLNYCL